MEHDEIIKIAFDRKDGKTLLFPVDLPAKSVETKREVRKSKIPMLR